MPKIPDDGSAVVLAKCLFHGKELAIGVFGPMVEMMVFKPETISGVSDKSVPKTTHREPPSLIWSDDPGCFERHLQRKHLNPLFPPNSRIITQDEVDAARSRDASEADALWAKIIKHVESIPKNCPFLYADLLERRSLVDDLMHEAAETGSAQAERATCSLYWEIIKDMEEAMKDNPKERERLQAANELYVKVGLAYKNRFVAQSGRNDSPIKPAEMLPSLLTEDSETIRKFLIIVNDRSDSQELLQRFGAAAAELVEKLRAAGTIPPQVDEKLKALGIQVDNCAKDFAGDIVSPVRAAEVKGRNGSTVSELGKQYGKCAKCSAIILMESRDCPKCLALFGPESKWKVLPLSAQ